MSHHRQAPVKRVTQRWWLCPSVCSSIINGKGSPAWKGSQCIWFLRTKLKHREGHATAVFYNTEQEPAATRVKDQDMNSTSKSVCLSQSTYGCGSSLWAIRSCKHLQILTGICCLLNNNIKNEARSASATHTHPHTVLRTCISAAAAFCIAGLDSLCIRPSSTHVSDDLAG
jgi:hypothetical protein